MKKLLAVLVIITMTLGLLAACGSTATKYTLDISPYDELDFSEYVKLPDNFDKYEYKVEEYTVTDEDVETEIQTRLSEASETTEVTEGTVDKGDTVKIAFKGTLEDGSTQDGMNTDGTEITLGSAGYIDGFEEGLYGATIGKPVTLDLQFPDPYEPNTDLSGAKVTFEVTVLSKKETKAAELNEDFIKTNSEGAATTEEEYREYIKKNLQDYANEQMEFQAKQNLLKAITNDCEVIKYPEEEVEALKTSLIEQYKSYAESSQMKWEDFVKQQFESEEKFNEQLDTYVKEVMVANYLKIYGLCKQEGITLTDDDYTAYINEMFENFGVSNEEEFQAKANMTLDAYVKAYDVKVNMFAGKLLDKIVAEKTGETGETESEG